MIDYGVFTEAECESDGYPAEWHISIKQAVRAAAGHRCIRCGHPYPPGVALEHPGGIWTPCDAQCDHDGPVRARSIDGSWHEYESTADAGPLMVLDGVAVQAEYRILTVHHLDGIKGNCRWWNLTALCQRCHLTVQGKVQMERVYPWPHSDWFRPYVAGYYAWTYLGEELSREATEARLEELLALELYAGGPGAPAATP